MKEVEYSEGEIQWSPSEFKESDSKSDFDKPKRMFKPPECVKRIYTDGGSRILQTEKQKLIKEGKIKKDKPLPPITDDEIPFEIPSTWKWVSV